MVAHATRVLASASRDLELFKRIDRTSRNIVRRAAETSTGGRVRYPDLRMSPQFKVSQLTTPRAQRK